jgi:hypothetical protein
MTRKMGQFDVFQRTQDGFFNATELLNQWDKFSGQQKQMIHYTDIEPTKEFMKALLKEENLKERSDVLIQKRGKNGGTWMHPLLFIDFAMWLNSSFKVKVLRFVYDELIKYRHGAGDMYVGLSKAITKFKNVDYQHVAKALNYIVFGKHEAGIRNTATVEELKELEVLEKNLSFSLDMGLIKSFESLIEQMRVIYNKKWNPIKSLA